MCGIAGKFIFGEGAVFEESIKSMTDNIVHRGPDDEGFYVSPNKKVGLGHKRLKIIDLSSAGHQPMANEDKTIWLVFNGEIYNFQELKPDLIKKGHHFISQTDTEVILHLYEEYGKDCLAYLKGMFAFSLYDEKKDLLFGARDRTGIKPFYYIYNNKGFTFCSEIKGFYGNCNFSKTLNLQAIYDFLTLRYIPWPQTPYRDVLKLAPGHYFVVEKEKLKIFQYSGFDFNENFENIDYQDRFKALFEESVQKHLLSDVPLGVFLSGGTDSLAVLSVMKMLGIEDIKTFSIGYDDKRFCELDDAKRISEIIGTRHFEKRMSKNDFLNNIDKCIYFMDEPVADLASVPLYLIAQEASEHIKVILSGEGADELFAGYSGFNYEYIYFQTLSFFRKDWEQYFKNNPHVMTRIMDDNEKHILLKQGLAQDIYSTNRIYKTLNKRNLKYHPINNKLSRLMEYWLVDDLLQKADKMTMACSIELRVPFLYEDIINFACNLPIKYKVRFGFNEFSKKVILKRFLLRLFPKEIVGKKKRGFGHPVYRWYLEDKKIAGIVNQLILNSSLIREFFNPKTVHGIIASKNTQKIFNLFILSKWAKIHL